MALEELTFVNKNLIKNGETIAVALSGGKDSMFLFAVLLKLKDRLNFKVKALNVNHGIRGETSNRDSLFVKDYCNKVNVPLLQKNVDALTYSKDNGLSVEEGARYLRYEFFKSAVESGFCDRVATAHHLSDFTETVLFNLFRGASPSGLNGIPETAFEGKIIRPILKTDKSVIDAYVKENSIPYVDDETNFSDEYSRNFLRLKVIPVIKERFPEFEGAINRFTEILKQESDILDLQAKNLLSINNDEIRIPYFVEDAIYSRACILAMKYLGVVKDYEKSHIDALIELKRFDTGRYVTLPKGIIATKDYNGITFFKKTERDEFVASYSIGEYSIGKKTLKIVTGDYVSQEGEKVLYFDADKIPNGAEIRYRREGDYFTKFGGGTKSLGDYMTNKKIPLRERDLIPVVAYGNEILVVCGVEISEKVRVDEKTLNINKIILN